MKPRDNPFCAARIDDLRCRITADDRRRLWDRLEFLRWRGAIVGPHGHGKTTLLRQLASELIASGQSVLSVRLCEERPGLTREEWRQLAASRDVVILVDGAEQLSWLSWHRLKWLARRADGLIVTCHRPRLLPTAWECRTDIQLLVHLMADLSGQERREVEPLACDLFLANRGNLREALRDCYDRWSILSPTGLASWAD